MIVAALLMGIGPFDRLPGARLVGGSLKKQGSASLKPVRNTPIRSP
jgi:hypothetical protein